MKATSRSCARAVIYQRPKTSMPAPGHKIYPYLLRGLTIDRPNQVWCTDLTYIPLARGFLYLVAIMDWWSRKVLAWRLSNTMEAEFCVDALEEAMDRYGKPEIFNSDQGSQFTSTILTQTLKRAGVRISMDGSHFLVEPVACTPAAGWEKGQVENQVGTVRGRFFTPRLRVKSYAELNAWLLDKCIVHAKAHHHPEFRTKTVWQVFEEERTSLVPYAGRFPACTRLAAKVGLVMPDLRSFAPADRDISVTAS